MALGNQPASAWSAGVEPALTPQLALLAVFSRLPSVCYPLLYHPPVLCWLCADETCSALMGLLPPSQHCVSSCREGVSNSRGVDGYEVLLQVILQQDVIVPLS